MKLLNTILCVCFLVIPMEGQKKTPHAAPGSECTIDAHAHQFNDLRFAAIEVVKIGKCGFSFVDLEEHTVGLDNYFQFADDFVVVNVKKDQESSAFLEMRERSKQAVKENARCLAMYCYVCKVAFSLKPMQDDRPSLR